MGGPLRAGQAPAYLARDRLVRTGEAAQEAHVPDMLLRNDEVLRQHGSDVPHEEALSAWLLYQQRPGTDTEELNVGYHYILMGTHNEHFELPSPTSGVGTSGGFSSSPPSGQKQARRAASL